MSVVITASSSASTSVVEPKILDTLSLLALKVAPNVFDLSSGQQHVSIRDQIVRAQILIRDLLATEPKPARILVVGAGIAGVTAALAAAAQGVDVRVVDSEAEPFSLQRKAPGRFVGPFMYEWPSDFFNNQDYPPSPGGCFPAASIFTPKWKGAKPISGRNLANQLSEWLTIILHSPHPAFKAWRAPAFWMAADKLDVIAAVKHYAAQTGELAKRRLNGSSISAYEKVDNFTLIRESEMWPSGSGIAGRSFQPDYILLGAGLGDENVQLPPIKSLVGAKSTPVGGKFFWAQDNLVKADIPNLSIGVFAGGDGALQDVLRALTGKGHPLEIIEELEKKGVGPVLASVRDQLMGLEQQGRLITTWTGGVDAYATLDEGCRQLATALAKKTTVRNAIRDCIRIGDGNGTVFHFVRETHFGKAYLLNRFLVHLVIACHKKMGEKTWGKHMRYECHFGAEAISSRKALMGFQFSTEVRHAQDYVYRNSTRGNSIVPAGQWFEFHEVSVRFGSKRLPSDVLSSWGI